MDAVTFALLKKKLETKASLVDGKVPAEELPSYVDDVVEYEDLAHFPEEGERSKIYVALDTGCTYRWSGSAYVQIGGQDLSDYYTKEETQAALSGKQDTIEDLSSIRSGAYAGATAVQPGDLIFATDSDIEEEWMPFVMKGDIISMNLDGVNRNYRILSINGTIAKVVAMFTASANVKYNAGDRATAFSGNTRGQQYAGGTLDIYLNTTWYDTLSSDAKSAIVPQTLTQRMWHYNSTAKNPKYMYYRDESHIYYMCNWGETLAIGERNIYALDVQDIIDYLELSDGDEIRAIDIWQMFWNETTVQSDIFWLSAADAANSGSVFRIVGSSGLISGNAYPVQHGARPAFTIDLSKISFTFGGN